jgi:hypothetical protein
MWTINRLSLGMVFLLLGPAPKAAAAETLVGAVTGVSADSLRIKTNHGEERAVGIDAKTQYVRWITHQPWQQSTVADRSFVRTGRCVSVELRGADGQLAKLVRINTDEIGTVYCPCRSAR